MILIVTIALPLLIWMKDFQDSYLAFELDWYKVIEGFIIFPLLIPSLL